MPTTFSHRRFSKLLFPFFSHDLCHHLRFYFFSSFHFRDCTVLCGRQPLAGWLGCTIFCQSVSLLQQSSSKETGPSSTTFFFFLSYLFIYLFISMGWEEDRPVHTILLSLSPVQHVRIDKKGKKKKLPSNLDTRSRRCRQEDATTTRKKKRTKHKTEWKSFWVFGLGGSKLSISDRLKINKTKILKITRFHFCFLFFLSNSLSLSLRYNWYMRKHVCKIDRTDLDYLIPIIFNFFCVSFWCNFRLIKYFNKKKGEIFIFCLVRFLIVFVPGAEKPTIHIEGNVP